MPIQEWVIGNSLGVGSWESGVDRDSSERQASMKGRLLVCVVAVVLMTTNAWAQLASQTALVGTVTDGGGLVVPGAQVVAVNAGTGDTYEATTNSDGYYHIEFVRPGRYDITVKIA